MPAAVREGYESMRRRTRAIVVLLCAVIAIDLVAVGSTIAELSLLDRFDAGEVVPDSELDANDDRQAAVGLVQTVLLLATAVFFIRWLRLAYRNADVVAPGLRRYGHGWAIGAWFVPVLNLWRPKQIVNDAWRAGDSSGTPYTARLPALLNVWWAGWILTNLLGQVAARLAFRQDTVEELRTVDAWYIASDATDAVVALLALLVVRRITERLEARGAEAPAPLPWQPPQAPVASGADWSPTAPERPAADR
jgi:hypothetical protein